MVSLGWVGLEPAHNWDETSSLGVSIPYTNLGQVSAHPNEAMNSIKKLHLTAATSSKFGVQRLTGRNSTAAGELEHSAAEGSS
jgi:hypothetical protein